jgi:hypothetical protein
MKFVAVDEDTGRRNKRKARLALVNELGSPVLGTLGRCGG